MGRKELDYALYRGEELVYVGTARQIKAIYFPNHNDEIIHNIIINTKKRESPSGWNIYNIEKD